MTNSNVIVFDNLNCLTAEAIFGDQVEIMFASTRPVWTGAVNTNGDYPIGETKIIPQGLGAQIEIYQWYFGQPKELVYISEPISRTDVPEARIIRVNPNYDKDPNGEYVLTFTLKLDDFSSARRVKMLRKMPR